MRFFTDDGENNGGSIFELQCTATAALPQSTVIGSQFCEVQGVRGAGQWDLGWGWHMATEYMAQAYEQGDPRKNSTYSTSATRTAILSHRKTPTNHTASLRFLRQ